MRVGPNNTGFEVNNLCSNLPALMEQESFQSLVTEAGMKIERIVSYGHSSPAAGWYDQDQDEWVMVVQGEGKLEFEGDPEVKHMCAGDYIHIPAHCRHRVIWTRPDTHTIWLAIFF